MYSQAFVTRPAWPGSEPKRFYGSLESFSLSYVLRRRHASCASLSLDDEPAVRIAPMKDRCFIDAVLAMALAAKFHASDVAVMKAGMRYIHRLQPDAQALVVGIVYRPDPMAHLFGYVSKISDRVLNAPLAA